jgi:hypothetical protein
MQWGEGTRRGNVSEQPSPLEVDLDSKYGCTYMGLGLLGCHYPHCVIVLSIWPIFYYIGFHFSLLLISNFLYKKKRIEKSHLCPNSLLHNELCIPYSMSNFILLQAFHFLEFYLLFLLFFHVTTFIKPTHKKLYLFHVILGVE